MTDSGSSPRTVLWLFGALILGLLAVVFLWPRIEEARSPRPRACYVAIQVNGAPDAVVGRIEAPPATGFELHAVVEAVMPDDSIIYMTNAPGLEIAGSSVDPKSIRPLEFNKPSKTLWFTVEGALPFLKIESPDAQKRAAALERFQYQEFLHPEWGLAPSLKGSIASQYETRITEDTGYTRGFGIQRFQVWVEIFAHEDAPVPEQRLKSPGKEQVEELGSSFPTVVLADEGPLGVAQRVFGLSQIESIESPDGTKVSANQIRQELKRIAQLASASLAFSRASVLRDLLTHGELEYDDLEWRLVDFGEVAFEEGTPRPGDLLRVGSRFVVLLEDTTQEGRLDGSDLCLDFEEGAAIRPLDEVFIGEDGSVEWAQLSEKRKGP